MSAERAALRRRGPAPRAVFTHPWRVAAVVLACVAGDVWVYAWAVR